MDSNAREPQVVVEGSGPVGPDSAAAGPDSASAGVDVAAVGPDPGAVVDSREPADLRRRRRVRGKTRRRPTPGLAVIERDLLCLQPTSALQHRTAAALVEAVLTRVGVSEPVPSCVVLSLEVSEEIDDDACDALLEIYFRLRASGIRLYLGALPRDVFERLRRNGVVDRVGVDAVWPSLQTALLAAYEDLAGPAVVTRAVVAQLHRRVFPLPV